MRRERAATIEIFIKALNSRILIWWWKVSCWLHVWCVDYRSIRLLSMMSVSNRWTITINLLFPLIFIRNTFTIYIFIRSLIIERNAIVVEKIVTNFEWISTSMKWWRARIHIHTFTHLNTEKHIGKEKRMKEKIEIIERAKVIATTTTTKKRNKAESAKKKSGNRENKTTCNRMNETR